MTLTEIVELVSERIGAEPPLVWGFVQSFIETVSEELDRGNEVKIRGLGTFRWVEVPGRDLSGLTVPPGKKLKFYPGKKFKHRRSAMSDNDNDEGMTKYAVVTKDDKTKTASKGGKDSCPDCGDKLDDGGACPKDGTKPFEPKR